MPKYFKKKADPPNVSITFGICKAPGDVTCCLWTRGRVIAQKSESKPELAKSSAASISWIHGLVGIAYFYTHID